MSRSVPTVREAGYPKLCRSGRIVQKGSAGFPLARYGTGPSDYEALEGSEHAELESAQEVRAPGVVARRDREHGKADGFGGHELNDAGDADTGTVDGLIDILVVQYHVELEVRCLDVSRPRFEALQ